jgi:hypothetical protein
VVGTRVAEFKFLVVDIEASRKVSLIADEATRFVLYVRMCDRAFHPGTMQCATQSYRTE